MNSPARTWLYVVLCACALSAWVLPRPALADTRLQMASDPGDPFGNGQSYFYTPTDGTFSASHNFPNVATVTFNNASTNWRLEFAGPYQRLLGPGIYSGAVRYPFQSDNSSGLSVSGNGLGCNTITGEFRVRQAVYGAGNSIVSFWATFEQHCDGAVPALRGEVRINADTALYVLPPSDVYAMVSQPVMFDVSGVDTRGRPVTLTATNLPAGSSFTDHGDGTGTFQWPSGGMSEGSFAVGFLARNDINQLVNSSMVIHVIGDDRLHMMSDPGDYIGQGRTWDYTEANATFVPATNFQNGVSFNVTSGDQWWYLDFAGPKREPLYMGSYENATRFPFNEPGPGLDISGNGRGCNMLNGRFDVLAVEYGPSGTPETFWAMFEQHCEGGVPALRGEIHFGKGTVTPVTISLADVETEPGHVILTWYSAEPLEAAVERRGASDVWGRVGSVTRDGSGWLRFDDRDVIAGGRYAYRLAYSRNGAEEFTSELWVDVPGTLALALGGLRPNPAVAELVTSFTLPRAAPASLELVDLGGRRILAKDVGALGAGRHEVRIADAGAVSPGVYWLILRQGSERKVSRAVVVR